jgi:hypothetical protein
VQSTSGTADTCATALREHFKIKYPVALDRALQKSTIACPRTRLNLITMTPTSQAVSLLWKRRSLNFSPSDRYRALGHGEKYTFNEED